MTYFDAIWPKVYFRDFILYNIKSISSQTYLAFHFTTTSNSKVFYNGKKSLIFSKKY